MSGPCLIADVSLLVETSLLFQPMRCSIFLMSKLHERLTRSLGALYPDNLLTVEAH